ncbi:interleukin 12Ba [Anoplopoma fimbria]|uniref:interleukin 12Ba n=1 Tax=Anoplopoma fimbria TaxID=229290 RepID=UPI0023EE0085|nr:interleukin 12Ba [Anoplopoma fimbria]
MKLFVFSFVCAFLQVSHQNPTSQWIMTPHVLVLVMDGTLSQQSLSCLERPEELLMRVNNEEDISWRKNGEEEAQEEAQKGNTYLLDLKESFGGGNYTCHSKDGALLNYTEVLIQDDESDTRRILLQTNPGNYLDCSAKNYNGEFKCSWTWHKKRVGKVAFIKARRVSQDDETECSVDESGRRWTCSSGQGNFSCSVNDSRPWISCLDQQHCPYAEERQPIHITVYVRTEHFLVENYSKYFYLSEIVKPDMVTIISEVNSPMIEWSYPSSWSSPYSYFPLTFQVLQLKGRCKRVDNPCTVSTGTKISTVHSTCQFKAKRRAKCVCIRAKDVLVNSQWSDWRHSRLTHKRKKHQQKQITNLTEER